MRLPVSAQDSEWPSRRDVLRLAGISAGSALVLPAQASAEAPSAAPILVSLESIEPGEQIVVPWNERPVFVRRRTPAEIEAARSVAMEELRDPQPDEERVRDPEWLIVIGECPHAGCRPLKGLGRFGGWVCFCHGSQFDTSGRVRRGPALTNLEIPPYRFLRENMLEIGG